MTELIAEALAEDETGDMLLTESASSSKLKFGIDGGRTAGVDLTESTDEEFMSVRVWKRETLFVPPVFTVARAPSLVAVAVLPTVEEVVVD